MFHRRALLLGGLQLGVGALLVGRMAQLSVSDQRRYALAAEDNRVALHLIAPRRGWIVDAAGEPLATNRPAYAVELIPSLVPDLDAALDRIATIVPLGPDDRARIHEEAANLPPSAALTVASDIGWDAFAAVNLELADMAGLQPARSYVRHYPDGEAFGHLIGYVGPPTAEQYRANRNPLYLLPAFRIGKDGVERARDTTLTGTPGARRVEVNARGRIVRELDTRPDQPGANVRLSIDRALQAFAGQRIGSESASAVVIDCLTGEIRCMISMPAFDPNIFSNRIPARLWRDLQASETKPLLNKTLQGLYVPGSTFKMVTALAALSGGVLPSERVSCGGRYTVGGHSWHCHRRGGHGAVDMRSGIAKSCNVYFYAMARKVGGQLVADTARLLGLEARFDLPMPQQRRGIVPDGAWKKDRFGQDWTVADTLNMSIGQGYLIANPLQLAVMTARIATGTMVEPTMLPVAGAPSFRPLPIPAADLEVVRQGMDDVLNGPGGTARSARLNVPGLRMAGKTGTAQVRRITAAERRQGVRRNESLPWRFRDHALFVAFAPVEAPRYAVAVVVEHGMSGGRAAAPIARDLVTFLYDRPRAQADLARLLDERERRERARAAAATAAAAAAADTAARDIT